MDAVVVEVIVERYSLVQNNHVSATTAQHGTRGFRRRVSSISFSFVVDEVAGDAYLTPPF